MDDRYIGSIRIFSVHLCWNEKRETERKTEQMAVEEARVDRDSYRGGQRGRETVQK